MRNMQTVLTSTQAVDGEEVGVHDILATLGLSSNEVIRMPFLSENIVHG